MLRVTFKSLLSRKFRLLLTSISIVLGVSFVSGAFVLTDSLNKRFESLFASVSANTNVEVRGTKIASDLDADTGEDRHKLPESLLADIRGVDGVDAASGSVSGQAVLVGKDGDAVASVGPPQIGASYDDTPLSSFKLSKGEAPATADEIVMTVGTAKKGKVGVGDTVTVLTSAGPDTFTISGLMVYRNGDEQLGGETYIAFQTERAQELFDAPGQYNTIDVKADKGVSDAQLKSRIQEVVGSEGEVLTNAELNAETTSDIGDALGFFKTFLLVFAGVALFVGAFIIANTFSILVAQRTRELALLRAMGASRRQITRSVLIEAVAVGLASSIVGLFGGVGLSYGLQALFKAIGSGFPDGATIISVRTVIVALLVGVGVTAAAALFPARKAAKVAPVAALREAATPDRPLRRQVIIGVVLAVAGGAAMFAGLTSAPIAVLGLGVVLVFLGVALLSPVLSRPVVAFLGLPFRRRIPGRLGRDNAGRNPRRTAATAAALMIGLALVGAIGTLGASVKSSITDLINNTTNVDFVIQSKVQNGPVAGVPEDAVTAIQSVSGIKAAGTLRFDNAKINGSSGRTDITASNADILSTVLVLTARQGDVKSVSSGDVLVDETYAKDHSVKLGSQLAMEYESGKTSTLTVTGVFKDYELAGTVIVDEAEAQNFANTKAEVVLVKLAAGVKLSKVHSELNAAVKPFPAIQVQDRTEFTNDQTSQIDQVVNVFQGFLVLAIIIAAIGIVNTLALSVLERTRELGLLRAIGMHRRQVKRMVRVESVIIAVFGALLGIVVGVGFGIALQQALKDQGIQKLGIPWMQLVIYVVIAMFIGVVAAVLPARRAARLNVLDAIKSE
jgi:putative ABC transport system permease protein